MGKGGDGGFRLWLYPPYGLSTALHIAIGRVARSETRHSRHEGRHEPPRRIMSKNSTLFFVAFILSRMNSIASISSIP